MSVFDKVHAEYETKHAPTGSTTENKSDAVDKPQRPTWKQSEDDLLAPYLEHGYRAQISTVTDNDGNIVEVAYGTKGSRRPDAINLDSDHVELIEVKRYDITTPQGKNNLVRNIDKQTGKSLEAYGADVEITEVIDLRGLDVTVGDMETLTEKLEDKVPEIGIDYRW